MFTEHVQSRRARREATRQQVLASAEDLFRHQGFAATTVRQIAARAGVSVGTVMAVGDKSALLIAIFDEWIAAVHRSRSVDPSNSTTRLTPAAAVREVMSAFEPFIDHFSRDLELSREYAAIIVRGTHQSAIFQDLAPVLIAQVNQVLSRSGLTSSAASHGARIIFLSYLGLVMIVGDGALSLQASVDQFREVIRFVVSPRATQPPAQ
ncbi:MAG: TetR/AcrR family transcriptional regulator [Mycobacterium sp.]